MRIIVYFGLFIGILVFISCDHDVKPSSRSLFQLRHDTGIDFSNDLVSTEALNPYTYRNFYNGGGVALGDINNDGLIDIYFTGNQVDNKLYLNKGGMQFEDITQQSGVACKGNWSTGATFVDINGDGLLDIYVCKAGPPGGENRNNQLFINKGDLTFEDQSEAYGLDLVGLSIHSAFFDFDKDGDLDCYLLSNSIRSVGSFDLIKDQREVPDAEGNKLLINDNGVFRDASAEHGIYSSKIGYGLGITLSDFNHDGWTDIFVSNDFFEKDYLYINQEGKGFKEEGEAYFQCFSLGSMGADAADLDNDLMTDLFVTEMLPRSNERKKTKMIYDSWDKYRSAVNKGYYHQAPRNMLQRNMGEAGFLELGRRAGVAGTDWSWASLLCDLDNDGWKDIFVSNGIGRDLLDRDYLAYTADGQVVKNMLKEKEKVIQQLVDIMPSERVSNVTLRNRGDFQFEDVGRAWGLDMPSFSNGSAYGDLDNDGDLDLVISNVDDRAYIYENTSDTSTHHFLQINLKGSGNNTGAIGSRVEVYGHGIMMLQELYPSRGFQSSVAYPLHFGLGAADKIDSMLVYWPEGGIERLYDISSNTRLTLVQEKASVVHGHSRAQTRELPIQLLRTLHAPVDHQLYNEFNRDRLLSKMTSYSTPALAVADLNQDGYDDLFYGGGYDQSAGMLLSQKNSAGVEYNQVQFDPLVRETITAAEWIDADGDGDLDLYLGIGGRVFSHYSQEYQDRIYINHGDGSFNKEMIRMVTPAPISTGAVTILPHAGQAQKIFIGARVDIQSYGLPGSLTVFEQNGLEWIMQEDHALDNLGMITSVVSGDINGDGTIELIVGGEWMPITIFALAEDGKYEDITDTVLPSHAVGLWQTLVVTDLDHDGDLDLIAGNCGDNSYVKPGYRLYVSDYDNNGSTESILCYEQNGQYYPVLDKDEIISQLPMVRNNFSLYKDYAKASMTDLFGTEKVSTAITYELSHTHTAVWINNGGVLESLSLPSEVQYSSVHAIEVMDVDQDGHMDILMGGNDYNVKPQYGRNDASKGWILYGDKTSSGRYKIKGIETMNISGEIRAIKQLDKDKFVVAISDMSINVYGRKNEE